MISVVDRNIEALLAQRQRDEQNMVWQEKLARVISDFTGSMASVFVHLFIYGAWILINVGWFPAIKPFDASLVKLAMLASVEAIFLSTFILITQNQMMGQAERRAELNLQISLLAEHEVTRLITMVREIARKMDLKEAAQPDLDELARDVAPEKVLEHLNQHEQKTER